MSDTERTTVVFTGAMAEELRKAVASGEYASTSEAVRHGVRMWMKEREERDRKLEWLRTEIQKGIDSGPGERFEPEAFKKEMRAIRARETRKSA